MKKESLINTHKIKTPLCNEIFQFLKDHENKNTLNQTINSKSSNSILFKRKEAMIFKKPNFNMFNNNFCKIPMWDLPPSSNKKTLILDLDETLVHSNFSPIKDPDAVLTVQFKRLKIEINRSMFI